MANKKKPTSSKKKPSASKQKKPAAKKKRAGAPIKKTAKNKKLPAKKKSKLSNKRLNKGSSGYYKVYNILKKNLDGEMKPEAIHDITKTTYSFLKESHLDAKGKFKLTAEIIQLELGSKNKVLKLLKKVQATVEYDTYEYDYYNLDDEMEIRPYKNNYDVTVNLEIINQGILQKKFSSLNPTAIIGIINAWREDNGGAEEYPSGSIYFKERGDKINQTVYIVLLVNGEGDEDFLPDMIGGPEPGETIEDQIVKEAEKIEESVKEEPEKKAAERSEKAQKEEEETVSKINKERVRKAKAEADIVELEKLNMLIKALYEEAKSKKELGMSIDKTIKKIEELEDRRDNLI